MRIVLKLSNPAPPLLLVLLAISVLISISHAPDSSLTSARKGGGIFFFCTALPLSAGGVVNTRFGRARRANKEQKVQINGNPVYQHQVQPTMQSDFRGKYSHKPKSPTPVLIKSLFSILAASAVISILNGIQDFCILIPLLDKCISPFDWTQPFGALLTSAIVYKVISSVALFIIPLIDGLRGVDRSGRHGRFLKQNDLFKNLGINIGAPRPIIGFGIALAITVKVLDIIAKMQAIPAINKETIAGKIFMAAIGIPLYCTSVLILPLDIPDEKDHLPEDEPSAIRTIMRYTLLPFYPLVRIMALIFLCYVPYFKTLVTTPKALDKVGTFEMDVTSTDTVGKPIGFILADNIMDSSDRTLSRTRVLIEKNLNNWKEWLLREVIPRDDVKVPTDEQVWSLCSKSVLAYNVMDQIEGEAKLRSNEKCLDMTPMQFFITLPNYHYNVARVYLASDSKNKRNDKDGGGIPLTGKATKIVMNDGRVIYPTDGEEWELAKLHFISTANLFFPAMQHNWVHFHFVDGATAMAHCLFSRGSLLHSILEPFVLSNVHTNANGLGGIVVDSHPTIVNYNIDINPTQNEYFVNSIHHRSLAFYTGKSNFTLSDDVLKERIHFGFPPKFEAKDDVPYTVCLQQSYLAFYEFAKTVINIISDDSEALITFQHWCNEVVRRTSHKLLAANVNHIDILATFMWQVSFLHSLDHNGYFFRVEPMNGFSGAMCDYKSYEARRNMYTGDLVRIYRLFIQVAGKYFVGKPDDSLSGLKLIYDDLKVSHFHRKDELVNAVKELENKVNECLKLYINDDDIYLDCSKIASAILT